LPSDDLTRIRIREFVRAAALRENSPRELSGIIARRPSKMTTNKVWFITGAGRGMGVEFAKTALAAGHSVVATGRNIEAVRKAVGAHDELLVVKLDITDPASAKDAVE